MALAMLLACVPVAHGMVLGQAASKSLWASVRSSFGRPNIARQANPFVHQPKSVERVKTSPQGLHVVEPYAAEFPYSTGFVPSYVAKADAGITHGTFSPMPSPQLNVPKQSQWSQVWNDMRRAMGLGLLTVFGYKAWADLPEEAQQSFGPYVETKITSALNAMQSTRTKCASDVNSFILRMRCR
jgi:hypothetical protein